MTDTRSHFTIGGAFARTWWISAAIDVVLLIIGLIAGFSYANINGIFSALSGWILAVCFCEINALITVLLDKMGLKSSNYLVAMMQLWGFKILAVIILGWILLNFVPQNNAVFYFMLVFSACIFTMKNIIISATARIL